MKSSEECGQYGRERLEADNPEITCLRAVE